MNLDDHNPNSKVLTCCPECARLLLRYQMAAVEDKAIWQERIDAHTGSRFCMMQLTWDLDHENDRS